MRIDHFTALAANLPQILSTLRARAESLAIDEAMQRKLSIAVEELFLNTAHHGGAAVEVTLALASTTDGVTLIYEDASAAYNPFANIDRSVLEKSGDTRPVGGLGVILVEKLASAVRYDYGPRGNRITLTFALPNSPTPPR